MSEHLAYVRNLNGVLEAGNYLFFPGGKLSIGDGHIPQPRHRGDRMAQVTIGRNCTIAWNGLIMDADQHPIPVRGLDNRPVRIGDWVWIGARATVLRGVSIGDEAVVGAGAIVTHDVPEGAVFVGPSARVIQR